MEKNVIIATTNRLTHRKVYKQVLVVSLLCYKQSQKWLKLGAFDKNVKTTCLQFTRVTVNFQKFTVDILTTSLSD